MLLCYICLCVLCVLNVCAVECRVLFPPYVVIVLYVCLFDFRCRCVATCSACGVLFGCACCLVVCLLCLLGVKAFAV